MSITFSTAWYLFKCKFDASTYMEWMNNMLSNVNCYNLVIYSDENSCSCLKKYLSNPRIRLVIKPYEEFYNYRYKDQWIQNHEKNYLLRERVDWKVNMLWAEKVHFVYETMMQRYFETDFYGWCDIGYFRCEPTDITFDEIRTWPNPEKIGTLCNDKIYYACVQLNNNYLQELANIIMYKNEKGLPVNQIPPQQCSIAGGFFICHSSIVEWWRNTFDTKLSLYFENDYLVKDDQIIILDCIFTDFSHFQLCRIENQAFNPWFVFQRILL